MCVTVPDKIYSNLEDVLEGFPKITYDQVRRKILHGGKYAVTSVKRDENGDIGSSIISAWKRFSKWINESKYSWGGQQYLEEHLGFSDTDDHIGGVDLYVPIKVALKT